MSVSPIVAKGHRKSWVEFAIMFGAQKHEQKTPRQNLKAAVLAQPCRTDATKEAASRLRLSFDPSQ